MHIGLIGGIGPAATDYYYRGLIEGHAAAGRRLDLTIAHADVRQLVANLAQDRRDAQAAAFLPLVKRLQAAGARAAAVTSMAATSASANSKPNRRSRSSTCSTRSMPPSRRGGSRRSGSSATAR
jgi:hypothetical protein